jgi:hypothetical protein
VYLLGEKHYVFCARDPFTQEVAIHIASSTSNRNAKTVLEKAMRRFGKDITVVNETGASPYMAQDEGCRGVSPGNRYTAVLDQAEITEKKPYVERLIGTLQKECLAYHYEPMNVRELVEVTDSWLDKVPMSKTEVFDIGDTSSAPHESLKFLTPTEYYATLGLSIPYAAAMHGEVFYRCTEYGHMT